MNEIRNQAKDQKYIVGRWGGRRTYGQKFSDDVMIKRNGNLQSLKDFTNQNAKETTIYDVLDTYRGDLKMTQKAMLQHANTIADEFSEIKSMGDALRIQKMANEQWNSLPRELRAQFGNSKETFLEKGSTWAKNEISIYNQKVKLQKEAQAKAEAEAKKYAEAEAIRNEKINKLIEGVK